MDDDIKPLYAPPPPEQAEVLTLAPNLSYLMACGSAIRKRTVRLFAHQETC